MTAEVVLSDSRATEAIEKLREIQSLGEGDPEAAHSMADEVLCDLLRQLGFADVVEEWSKVEKWYA